MKSSLRILRIVKSIMSLSEICLCVSKRFEPNVREIQGEVMYQNHPKLIIIPLDPSGEICTLKDDQGNTLGTGSRDICEGLIHLLDRQAKMVTRRESLERSLPRTNVRAAIVI